MPLDLTRDTIAPHGLSERRLRYFFESATAGSIRAAADRLDVEPSVISRQIQQLERDLGTTLFERRGRGVKPTEAAQLVLDHYRERLAGEEALLVRLEELNGLQRGKIHIVAGEGFTEGLVLSVLNEFSLQYPKIQVTLELANVNEVVRRVAEDRAHLGLAYAPPTDLAIHVVAAKCQPVCVICRPDHPLASSHGPIGLRDILPYSVGLMMPGFGLRQQIQMVEFAEKIHFSSGLVTNSITALKHYVSAGLGLTFLPELSIAREAALGQLIAVRTDNAILEATSAQVIVRDKRPRSAATDRLLSYLTAIDTFGNPEPRTISP